MPNLVRSRCVIHDVCLVLAGLLSFRAGGYMTVLINLEIGSGRWDLIVLVIKYLRLPQLSNLSRIMLALAFRLLQSFIRRRVVRLGNLIALLPKLGLR